MSDTSPTEPSEASPQHRTRRRVPVWVLVLIGVAAGALVGIGASALLSDDDPGSDRLALQRADEVDAADQDAATRAFLAAWRRYRNATYTAEMAFERVATNGQSLRSASTFTQQPPKRAIRQPDSLLLTAGPDSRTCTTVNEQLVCAPAPAIDYATEIENELAVWRTAFDGATPYYRVSRPDENCFQLDLAVRIADPPYGDVARFCFDAATGALAKRQIVRATATDTEEATRISTDVPADAFAFPSAR